MVFDSLKLFIWIEIWIFVVESNHHAQVYLVGEDVVQECSTIYV